MTIIFHIAEDEQAIENSKNNIFILLQHANQNPDGKLDNLYAKIAKDISEEKEDSKGINFAKQVAQKIPDIIKELIDKNDYKQIEGAFAQIVKYSEKTQEIVCDNIKALYLAELILEETRKNRTGDTDNLDAFRDTLISVINNTLEQKDIGDIYTEIISKPKSFANSRFIASCGREVAKQTGMKREANLKGIILSLVDKFMRFIESWHKDKETEKKEDKKTNIEKQVKTNIKIGNKFLRGWI